MIATCASASVLVAVWDTTRRASASTTTASPALSGGAAATKPARRFKVGGSLLFPMQTSPRCQVLDNFGDPRPNGRIHEGVDLLATLGQEVYAVADGTLTHRYVVGDANASLSGNAWTLTLPDRTYYFYAHLSRFVDGLTVGSAVRKGDVIGYVGDTGDAGPGNFHLHFEVHPLGGAAVTALPLFQMPAECSIT